MRRAALKQSELISSIGWKNGDMEIRYRPDGAVFVYRRVPYTIYTALQRSKNPGHNWLAIRDQYTYDRIR
jgi:hypothetical protein